MINIGDIITFDCYMQGIGNLDNLGNTGILEAYGDDWVIIRDVVKNEPIFINKPLNELLNILI